MAFLNYENLNYGQISALNRRETVIFVPCGPLEQHGPHLPLGTDGFSARYFAELAAERMRSGPLKNWSVILYPTVFLGVDVLDHVGSVEVKARTLRAVLLDIVAGLAKSGFKNIVLVGGHGGPRHLVVLEEVAARARWRWRARVISVSSRVLPQRLAGGLWDRIFSRMEARGEAATEQERAALEKDFHGGLMGTSIMLLAKPDLVGEIYKVLQPAVLGSIWKLRKNSGKTLAPGLGYLGFPALSRPAFGVNVMEVLLDETIPRLERYCGGEKVEGKFRSLLYYIPFLRTDFPLVLTLLVYSAIFLMVVKWSARVIGGL